MAPSTRLQVHPERRINYAESSRLKQTRRNTKQAQPFNSVKRKRTARVMTGAVVKAKAESRMPPRSPETEKNTQPEPEKSTQPETEECLLCTEDFPSHSNAPKDACGHFLMICSKCIESMLNVKATQCQLENIKLPCPFPECSYILGFKNLRTLVDEAAFKAYDIAITKHLLSTNESYMSCISIGCGLAFSIEDSKGNKIRKQWVECPYCDFKICMECNRPWTEHGEGGCDQIKMTEDRKSLAKIKEMGAKSCPSCGVKIAKDGGCNHMTCGKCYHHFCWKCSTEYSEEDECDCHRPSRPHRPIRGRNRHRRWH